MSCVDKLTRSQKRYLGIAMAMLSGIFYGSNFDPPQYLIDNRNSTHLWRDPADPKTAPSGDVLDYVFSHFTGIYLTSILYMMIYACALKGKPNLYPRAMVPGFISGIMWSVAQVSWFIANSKLGFAVSFPLVTSGPGFVAAMWGLFLFREITGKRNYVVLAVAFVITVSSGICISLSRSGGPDSSGSGHTHPGGTPNGTGIALPSPNVGWA